MLSSVFNLVLITFAYGSKPKLGEESIKAVRKHLLDEVRTKTSLWKATIPIRFENASGFKHLFYF